MNRPPPPAPSLCECDDATFWPWLSWETISRMPGKADVVVVVPVAGFGDHGADLPLDVEARVLMRVLKAASRGRGATRLLVLPPLRFVTGAADVCAFAVDPPTAHAFIDEVCASVAAAGFSRVVLCNASPCNEALCDAAARDIRIDHGLQMFCVNLSALRIDFGASCEVDWSEAGARLAALFDEIARRPPLAAGGRLEVRR